MPSTCALTNVEPSQATPSTQTQAVIPERKVEAAGICAASILVSSTIPAAAASMKVMIASLRPSAGFSIRPIEFEIAAA
ncbi:Uncharacterised protein [Vibrio cholerae]|nr:Uncharacterised protein [Vibrio cholerae]CSI83073.1 Uncharacterised protein [Vibrio cholerae]